MTDQRSRRDGLFPPVEWLDAGNRGSWEGIDLMQRVFWAQADGAMSEEPLSAAAEWVAVHLSLLQAQLVQEQN